jgi:hypothetical protein
LNCILIYILYLDILAIEKISKYFDVYCEAVDEEFISLNRNYQIYLFSQAFLFVISNGIFILIAIITFILTILNGFAWLILCNICLKADDRGFYECSPIDQFTIKSIVLLFFKIK